MYCSYFASYPGLAGFVKDKRTQFTIDILANELDLLQEKLGHAGRLDAEPADIYDLDQSSSICDSSIFSSPVRVEMDVAPAAEPCQPTSQPVRVEMDVVPAADPCQPISQPVRVEMDVVPAAAPCQPTNQSVPAAEPCQPTRSKTLPTKAGDVTPSPTVRSVEMQESIPRRSSSKRCLEETKRGKRARVAKLPDNGLAASKAKGPDDQPTRPVWLPADWTTQWHKTATNSAGFPRPCFSFESADVKATFLNKGQVIQWVQRHNESDPRCRPT